MRKAKKFDELRQEYRREDLGAGACGKYMELFQQGSRLVSSGKDEKKMPIISMFYGIIVSLYFVDNRRHKKSHIHARYQSDEAVVSISDGKLLEGRLPPAKMRLLVAWIEIHKDELMADWELAASGRQPYQIEPLR